MEELNEKLQEPICDQLTESIVARLAERRRKIERMQEMEKPAPSIRFVGRTAALVAAACFAAIMVLAPWHKVSPVDALGITPDLTEYRSASPDVAEIERLIDKSDYAAAIEETEMALLHYESELKDLKAIDMALKDEETEYEEQWVSAVICDLRWTYIYLLVKADRNEDAVRELNLYRKSEEGDRHIAEAEKLLDKLKKIEILKK